MSTSHAASSAVDWSAPLADLVVVDLSERTAAAFTGRLFAQLGADVRRRTSAVGVDAPAEVANAPLGYRRRLAAYLHAGKRTVGGVDESDPVEIVRAVQPDVVIHDGAHETAERLLDASATAVVVSLSPFGWTGPYNGWRSNRLVLQAAGGIANKVGRRDREPVILPGNVFEYAAGTFAYLSAMAMLIAPRRNGRHVLVTEIESIACMLFNDYTMFTRLGMTIRRDQFIYTQGVPSYVCRDGRRVVIAVNKPSQWTMWMIVCDRPEIIDRPEYATLLQRQLHAKQLDAEVEEWFASHTAQEAFTKLCEAEVPVAIVNTPEEAVATAQALSRGFTTSAAWGGVPLPFLLNGQRPGPRSTT